MEPIRILHMIGSLNFGGSQTMVLNLYRAIDREKVQFDFVLDHPTERDLANQVEALGARIYAMPSFNGRNIGEVRKAWHDFFREHPEYKVLHSHVRSYASVYLPIARKHGVKTIIHSHSTSNGTGLKAMVKAVMQYPLRYQADYFFSCSEEAGQWLFGKKVVRSDRHFVLKNAIDATAYRFNSEVRAQYRKMLGVSNRRVYVHVGRFHSSKNHGFLLEVFSHIHTLQPDAVLLLIGDGDLRQEIEANIRTLALADSVLLLGNRTDVHHILQAADCLLFPSLWEGLGIVAVEAQAAGLPCLCSDQVPGLAKVTENCRFLPLNQAELWAAEALNCKMIRQDTYAQIAAAGYDIHSSARWLSDFYSQLQERV